MKLKPIMKNKKGSAFDIVFWVIFSFFAVVLCGVVVYIFTTLTDAFQGVRVDGLGASPTIFADSFTTINNAQKIGIPLIAFAMVFFMGIGIMVANFMQRSHPAFFFFYLVVIIIAFMLAVLISNQYEILLTSQGLGDTLETFSAANFIMLYLPIWTLVFGFGGAIILFIGINRDAGLGGGII